MRNGLRRLPRYMDIVLFVSLGGLFAKELADPRAQNSAYFIVCWMRFVKPGIIYWPTTLLPLKGGCDFARNRPTRDSSGLLPFTSSSHVAPECSHNTRNNRDNR
jgi:hypothetical protein